MSATFASNKMEVAAASIMLDGDVANIRRKTPIQRDVRPFNDIKLAKKTLNFYIEKNIKKGWEKI